MKTWTPKTKLPSRKGWYITRSDDGTIDWRAWGCGAWWKQIKGGWIEWFNGDGQPAQYAFRKGSRKNISLDRDELPEPTP